MTLTNLTTAPPRPSNDPEWFRQGYTPEIRTSDFVIRSLRRRLWKAFQEDNAASARRAYQANKEEFEAWLKEEHEERQRLEESQEGKPKDRRSIRGKKPPSKRNLMISTDTAGAVNGSGRRRSSAGKTKAWEAAEGMSRFHSVDLKHLQGSILQSQMNPSDPFIADDFLSPYDIQSYDHPARKDLPSVVKHEREQQAKLARKRRNSNKPRLAAFNIFRRNNNNDNADDPNSLGYPFDLASESSDMAAEQEENIHMTTPLHEAARLGSGDFIRFLLQCGGDPNVKNGMARTALHMTSGGLTAEENNLTKAMRREQQNLNLPDNPIGIPTPEIPLGLFALMKEELHKSNKPKGTAKKAASAMGRMGRSALGASGRAKQFQENDTPLAKIETVQPDPARLNQLVSERMDAVLAILSWIHKDTGEGPSINAVDSDGRTALHYAAETGRADICMAILSNFGAMLTIIDELGGRTPCELAGVNGHPHLAAQLEARALLYIDPYGVDDELMANMMDREDGSTRERLAAPYKWFQTYSLHTVGEERFRRMETTRGKLLRAIQSWDTKYSEEDSAQVHKGETSDELYGSLQHTAVSDDADSESPMATLMATAEKDGLVAALSSKGSSDVDDEGGQKQSSVVKSEKIDDKLQTNSEKKLQSDFLNLREHHVERLLMHFQWSVSDAVKAFKKDPKATFSKAGMSVPGSAPRRGIQHSEDRTCLICYDDEVQIENWISLNTCVHGFCRDCLVDYVKDAATSKTPLFSLACPHHECNEIMSQSDIESILQDDDAALQRLQEGTKEQFVSSAHDFKFCTYPGCSGVVRRLPLTHLSSNKIDLSILNYVGAVCTACPSGDRAIIGEGCPLTYEGIEDLEYNNCRSLEQPPKAHRFCFSCGESKHWPVTCDRLEEWHKKVKEEVGEVEEDDVDGEGQGNYQDLAQKMWIKANTRPCPKCEVPIEKNDGCNHMTCTNPTCRHEFCWICRKDWKLHGTATGGFFRCNIWQEEGQESNEGQAPQLIPAGLDHDVNLLNSGDEGFGTAIHSAREAYKQRQEMGRFLHHYTRWEAHGQSLALERKMGDSVCVRLAPVVAAATDFDGSPSFNFGGKGLSFVHSAFFELLECRSVLKYSYAFSYFRYPTFYQFRRYGQLNSRRREKMTFERLQSELEMITEQMSDIVARKHLRATQIQITYLTAGAAEKREEFTNLMFSILHEERKEAKAEQSGPTLVAARSPESRRHRALSSTTMERRLRRLLADDNWPLGDGMLGEGTNDGIRAGIGELMARGLNDVRHDPATQMWECRACTYMNDGGHMCAMCGTFR